MTDLRLFTSESVTEGHPDKICDQISDSILDAILAEDPSGRVAVETLVTTGLVHVAGEVSTSAYVEIPRSCAMSSTASGTPPARPASTATRAASACRSVRSRPTSPRASTRRSSSVSGALSTRATCRARAIRASCSVSRPTRRRSSCRWPRGPPTASPSAWHPSGKTARCRSCAPTGRPRSRWATTATRRGRSTRSCSRRSTTPTSRRKSCAPSCRPRSSTPCCARRARPPDVQYYINPAGPFVIGGPKGDAGLTGARSSSTPTAGPRATAAAPSAQRPVQGRPLGRIRDALGREERGRGRPRRPPRGAGRVRHRQGEPGGSVRRVFGTAHVADDTIVRAIRDVFDLRPKAIIDQLDLLRRSIAQTAAYGHFGRELPDFTWERTDRVDALRTAAGL